MKGLINMKCKILGKKKSVFVDEKTGQLKQYARLFYSYNAPANTEINTYDGVVTDTCAIPFDAHSQIPLGSTVALDFNQKGQCIGIDILEVPENAQAV